MFCGKCGAQINNGERFCGSCGEAVNVQPVNQPSPVPVYQPATAPAYQSTSVQSVSNFKPLCLIAIIICAILWLAAPFISINLLTLGDQPSALQFITDDIIYIGELSESPAFWAAVVSLIGIIICFLCAIFKKNNTMRVIAIITEIPMVMAFVEALSWSRDGFVRIFEALGIGYWGIFILFLIVIFASGKKHSAASRAQQ